MLRNTGTEYPKMINIPPKWMILKITAEVYSWLTMIWPKQKNLENFFVLFCYVYVQPIFGRFLTKMLCVLLCFVLFFKFEWSVRNHYYVTRRALNLLQTSKVVMSRKTRFILEYIFKVVLLDKISQRKP